MPQIPDITTLANSMGRNSPQEWQRRVGANPDRGGISYNPTPGSREWNIGYQTGRTLPDFAMRKGMLRPLRHLVDNLGTNHIGAGAAGAVVGGALGAGSAMFSGGSVGRGAVAGAGAGMAGMLLASLYARNRLQQGQAFQLPRPEQPWREKRAYYATSDSDQSLQQKLMSDASMSYTDKSMLMQQLRQLSAQQKEQLANAIGPALGAGIGVLIARYLLKLGIGGTAMLALIGGAAGAQFGGTRNAYGQRANTAQDVFGRPRYV
jgi:hypothetical protein